jgi:hypothetical protein
MENSTLHVSKQKERNEKTQLCRSGRSESGKRLCRIDATPRQKTRQIVQTYTKYKYLRFCPFYSGNLSTFGPNNPTQLFICEI